MPQSASVMFLIKGNPGFELGRAGCHTPFQNPKLSGTRVLKRGMAHGSSQLNAGIVFFQEHHLLWFRPQRLLGPLPGFGRFRNAELLGGLGDDLPGWQIEAIKTGCFVEPAPLRADQR